MWEYVQTRPEIKRAWADEREKTADQAEAKLANRINAGDFQAIKFFFETQGRERGYMKTTEIKHQGTIKDDRPVNQIIVRTRQEAADSFAVSPKQDEFIESAALSITR